MELIQPSVDYKYSYLAAEGEFQAEGQHKGFDIEAAEKDFNTVVQRMHSWATGKDLPNNYNVPFTSYWLVDKGVYIGTVNIRHFLSERLQTIGGHIGYSIRPSMRKKGYGTAILRLALLRACSETLTPALIG